MRLMTRKALVACRKAENISTRVCINFDIIKINSSFKSNCSFSWYFVFFQKLDWSYKKQGNIRSMYITALIYPQQIIP